MTFCRSLLGNVPGVSCASQRSVPLSRREATLSRVALPMPRYPIGSGFHDPFISPTSSGSISPRHNSQSFVRAPVSLDERLFRRADPRSRSGRRYPRGHTRAGCAVDTLLARRRAPGAQVVASKDILIEEFGPLNDAGINLVIVLRDPHRAASTIGPSATDWSGSPRPLLYSVRL